MSEVRAHIAACWQYVEDHTTRTVTSIPSYLIWLLTLHAIIALVC